METVLTLVAVLLLVLLVLVSWHARARAIEEAKRLEAEGARGREIESIAMDAASLLAATLQSLETAQSITVSAQDESRTAVKAALRAARALSSLFHATRLYLTPQDDAAGPGSAEGCVRLAIALARSRGCGISVRGEHTALTFHGRASDACAVVLELLEASRGSLRGNEFIEVVLDEGEVRIVAGTAEAVSVDRAAGERVGWAVERSEREGRTILVIRPRTSGTDGSGSRVLAPRDALGLVR